MIEMVECGQSASFLMNPEKIKAEEAGISRLGKILQTQSVDYKQTQSVDYKQTQSVDYKQTIA